MNSKLLNPAIIFCSLFILMLISDNTSAQNNNQIRVSPKAWVGQTIGFTDVNITYSRPGVKGRKIYDALVPYGKVWRAGANEATKITFSTDVTVEGKKLAKGSYGLFVIPGEKEWTVIFNKTSEQWGAFEYNEAEDALRIKVKPQQIANEEWLEYEIEKATDTSAVISLEWEKVKVPFKVEGSAKQ